MLQDTSGFHNVATSQNVLFLINAALYSFYHKEKIRSISVQYTAAAKQLETKIKSRQRE